MTGIRKKNKILGFIFAVLAVWMVIFQNPSYAAQRGSLNIKTEQTGMTVYLYREEALSYYNEYFDDAGPEREAESMWFFGISRMERLSTL